MGKHRDDGEMSFKPTELSHKSTKAGDDGALGPDEGTPRKKRAGDGGALGPDEGTARADGAHAEFGGGKHEHSPHMPGTDHTPNC
jgi:hypothetical protein